MRTIWIVCWRWTEERFASLADALDRQKQLEALGIEAEVLEVVGEQRRRLLVAR